MEMIEIAEIAEAEFGEDDGESKDPCCNFLLCLFIALRCTVS
jgi:hypothetical protein